MSIDAKVQTAVTKVVKDYQQSDELTACLIAWFEAVSSGSEDINDTETTGRRIEILLETVNWSVDDLREDNQE